MAIIPSVKRMDAWLVRGKRCHFLQGRHSAQMPYLRRREAGGKWRCGRGLLPGLPPQRRTTGFAAGGATSDQVSGCLLKSLSRSGLFGSDRWITTGSFESVANCFRRRQPPQCRLQLHSPGFAVTHTHSPTPATVGFQTPTISQIVYASLTTNSILTWSQKMSPAQLL